MSDKKTVLLAFSGGLDTSAIVPWLKEEHNAEVIAYCSDLGNAPDKESLKKWAGQLGAKDFIFEDLKEEFLNRFVYPAIRANAVYQEDYLMGTALGRPLIAERMASWAKNLGAQAISHGATGKGNDQLRFENSWAYLVPEIEIIAPWKNWNFTGRRELLEYLSSKGIEYPEQEKLYSVDVNLLHRSCEGGSLEDPSQPYHKNEVWEWVTPPTQAPKESVLVTLEIEKGLLKSVNGKTGNREEIFSLLNQLAGKYGIGVADLVEERFNGLKSRGVYETPAGTVLHAALRHLKHLCWGRRLIKTASGLGSELGDLIYDGLWHTEACQSLLAYFEKAAESLTGTIVFEFSAGHFHVHTRHSPYSLYSADGVSFESDNQSLHKHAFGFCQTVAFQQLRAGERDSQCQRTTLKT